MIIFCRTETIFYQITSILFLAFPHIKEVQNATVQTQIKRSAFFSFAKLRKFRNCKCFPRNRKSFCRTEGSDIGCLSLIKRLLSIIFLIFKRGHPSRNSTRQLFQIMFSCFLKSIYISSDNSVRKKVSLGSIVPAYVELIFSNVAYMLILQNQKKTLNAQKHSFLSIPSDKIVFFLYIFRAIFISVFILVLLDSTQSKFVTRTLKVALADLIRFLKGQLLQIFHLTIKRIKKTESDMQIKHAQLKHF